MIKSKYSYILCVKKSIYQLVLLITYCFTLYLNYIFNFKLFKILYSILMRPLIWVQYEGMSIIQCNSGNLLMIVFYSLLPQRTLII